MGTATLNNCLQLDSTLLERVNYFPRQLLTADDMTADQEYFIAKLRRHNRYLHGWGVVCGLEVSVAPSAQNPWRVQIAPGYALGPYGDEIYVPNRVLLDLAQCGPGTSTDPCDPGSLLLGGVAKTGATLYIAIRYEECFSRPVRVLPGGCGCNDVNCEPSRINDSYEIECLADLPPSSQPDPQGFSLCDIINGRALAECPPCPTDPWVVLAEVTLPASTSTAISQSALDNFTLRRKVFSTAMIQEQVRLCCCAGTDRAPARVTSINPAAGTLFTDAATVPPAIVITFNKHLVKASVNANTIVVQRIVPNLPTKPVQGTVSYDDGTRTALFSNPTEPFTIAGVYLVTVAGSGPSAITDSDNLALDGNDDGVPGGNFISQFTVSTPQPTPTPTAGPTPTPFTGVVKGPRQIPNIKPSNPSAVGDLALTIAGGVAGKKLRATVTVTLSENLGKTSGSDTAALTDSGGNTVKGIKGPNTYTFDNVIIEPPGPTGSINIPIRNMKIDGVRAIEIGSGARVDVSASVSITGTTAIPLTGNPQIVARINGG